MTDVLLRDVTMRTHRASPLSKEGVLVGHNGDRVLMSMTPAQAEFVATVLGGLSPNEETTPLRLQVTQEEATVWHHAMVDLLACRAFVESLPRDLKILAPQDVCDRCHQDADDYEAAVAEAVEVVR